MLKISFNFDPETQVVSSVKVEDIPKKYKNVGLPIVKIENNKLDLSEDAIRMLSANCGDRIAVNYFQQNNELIIPVIAKAEVFGDPYVGNKLTKSNTVSFKGEQRVMLLKFGSIFKVEEHNGDMFKLTPIDEADLLKVNDDFEEEINNLNLI